ncbi:MAG TPA: hypothetical protein VFK30_12285, partial [Anaerolineae bacterium]|nr:hypothetical protein [Anaerolineae bacterium]
YQDHAARGGRVSLLDLIVAQWGLGNNAEADRLIQAAKPPLGQTLPVLALQERVRGQVAAAKGLPAEALTHLNQSIGLSEQQSAQLELGRTLLQRGLLMRQQGQLVEARLDFSRARSIFEACGAVRDQARVTEVE